VSLNQNEVTSLIQTTARKITDKWKLQAKDADNRGVAATVVLTSTDSTETVQISREWAIRWSSFVSDMLEHIPLNDDKDAIDVEVIPTGLTLKQLEQIKVFYFYTCTPSTFFVDIFPTIEVSHIAYAACLPEAHAADAFIASDYLNIQDPVSSRLILADAAVHVLVDWISSRLSSKGEIKHIMEPVFAYTPLFERVETQLSYAQNQQLKALTAAGQTSWIDATLHQGNVLGANPTWDLLMRYLRKQLNAGGAAERPKNLMPLIPWTDALNPDELEEGDEKINEFLDVMFADSHTSGWPGFECRIETSYPDPEEGRHAWGPRQGTRCTINGDLLLVAYDWHTDPPPTDFKSLKVNRTRLKIPINCQLLNVRTALMLPIWHDLNRQTRARLREMPKTLAKPRIGAFSAMWDYAFGGEDTPDFAGGFADFTVGAQIDR
jgi:hypothetical protein